MSPFALGFLKEASHYGVGDQALHDLANFFKHHPTSESLYSLSDDANSTSEEIQNIGKHIGGNAFSGAGRGAAVGGGIGLLSALGSSSPLKKLLSNTSKGALIGGTIEGARTAYELGDNTRSATIQPFESDLKANENNMPREDAERLRKNIQTMKDSPWFEYFYPPRVFQKLQ